MKNIDYINYIENKVIERFEGIQVIEKRYENLPNDAFIIIFGKKGTRLSFIYDRGYINGEIIKGSEYTPYWKLDDSLTNLWLVDTLNIDKIIDFLYKHRSEIFAEEN